MTRLLILPLLALAACQANAPDNSANDAVAANQAEAPVKEVETLPPDETVVEPENEAEAPAAAIPESMQGRWGLVPADCTSTRGDAKGLLTITGDTLQFYESRAKLAKIVGNWPEKLKAEFAFTGEGQSWTRTETLSLTNSSNTLVREDEELAQPLRYSRCK
ncbi:MULTISPECIES: hypothetical protein [Sphingomonas]|jgi:hypothetical protein|nr:MULTISPECIES: hypothetical protein [Sphingomonas]